MVIVCNGCFSTNLWNEFLVVSIFAKRVELTILIDCNFQNVLNFIFQPNFCGLQFQIIMIDLGCCDTSLTFSMDGKHPHGQWGVKGWKECNLDKLVQHAPITWGKPLYNHKPGNFKLFLRCTHLIHKYQKTHPPCNPKL